MNERPRVQPSARPAEGGNDMTLDLSTDIFNLQKDRKFGKLTDFSQMVRQSKET